MPRFRGRAHPSTRRQSHPNSRPEGLGSDTSTATQRDDDCSTLPVIGTRPSHRVAHNDQAEPAREAPDLSRPPSRRRPQYPGRVL